MSKPIKSVISISSFSKIRSIIDTVQYIRNNIVINLITVLAVKSGKMINFNKSVISIYQRFHRHQLIINNSIISNISKIMSLS